MEELVQQNFQIYKALGVGLSLGLVLLVQTIFPNRLQLRRLLSNWKVNVPLALIDAAIEAAVLEQFNKGRVK